MASSKDYLTKNFTLETFIPEELRNPTLSSILKNTFDRHLTKDESKRFYGYVGKKQLDVTDQTPFLKHRTEERRINNLQPMIVATTGVEEQVFSFNDVLNRCKNLGISTNDFYKWGTTTSYNFAPPIEFDKFVNYKRYYWVPKNLYKTPTINGNPELIPEYVVIIKRGSTYSLKANVDTIQYGVTPTGTVGDRFYFINNSDHSKDGIYEIRVNETIPTLVTESRRADDFDSLEDLQSGAIINVRDDESVVIVNPMISTDFETEVKNSIIKTKAQAIAENIPTISDWEDGNYWVHEDDFYKFDFKTKPKIQAVRPIIELGSRIELENNQIPGERSIQRKQYVSQQPIFSHYHFDGSRSETTGSIFSYTEDSNAAIDEHLQRRVKRENNTDDFLFSQSLIEPETKSTLFFKNITPIVSPGHVISNFESIRSIWISGIKTSDPLSIKIKDQKPFDSSDYVVNVTFIGEKEHTDTVQFTAVSAQSVEFESKILGKYKGPIIRTNVNPTVRNIVVLKDGSKPPSTESTPQTSDNLLYFLSNGYTEYMSPIFEGETVEIPDYLTMEYVPNTTAPVLNDSLIKKVYTQEVQRYVAYNSDDNLVDYYNGEDYDNAYAKATNSTPFGAWLVPNQIKQNISHENRELFAFGDLTGHFRLIMAEMAGIEGSLNGANNFRLLINNNYGLGGLIKNYGIEFNLLISNLLQDDITPLTILDFIESQYSQNLLSISEFVNKNIGNVFKKHTAEQIINRDPSLSFIGNLYKEYADYYGSRSDLLMFNDSTSPIPNWISTLPLFKITPIYEPLVGYDEEVGQFVIKHHDGHYSALSDEDFSFDYRLAAIRTGPYQTLLPVPTPFPGEDGPVLPAQSVKPWYKGMLWFDKPTNLLRVCSVISDTPGGDGPIGATIGDLWLDDQIVKIFDGIAWVVHSQPMDVWKIVSIACIIDSLILHIEKKLFESVIPAAPLYSNPTTLTQSLYEPDFVRFAAKYNFDTYAPEYISNNPWTWNYKYANFTIEPTLNGTARWEQIYQKYLGTKRPYLFPWKMTNTLGVRIANDSDIPAMRLAYATRFQDNINLTLFPLNNSLKIAEVRLVSDTQTAIGSLTLDDVTINTNDLIALVGQTNPLENGIYLVTGPGTWVKQSPTLTYDPDPLGCTWFAVTSGKRWKPSVWVTADSSLNTFEQYRYWKKNMWDDIKLLTGKKLCVNVYNDSLIPPYVHPDKIESAEALLTVFPSNTAGNPGIYSQYVFGDIGPIELAWRKSVEFRTTVARAKFKESPLSFLTKTWGDVYTGENSNYQYGRYSVKKLSHLDIVLHGEELSSTDLLRPSGFEIGGLESNVNDLITVKLTVVDQKLNNGYRTCPYFKMVLNNVDSYNVRTTEIGGYFGLSADIEDAPLGLFQTDNFYLSEHGHGFRLGDEITFTVVNGTIDQNTVVLKQNRINTSLGLNQTYTHLMKYNNYDTTNSFNNSFLRKWIVKYGYRFDSIVRSEDVKTSSETFDIPNSFRTIHLKNNPRVKDFWLHALRIQVVRIGKNKPAKDAQSFIGQDGKQVGIIGVVPDGDASDWEFRIENYNARQPFIDIFTYDKTGTFSTFNPLNEPRLGYWKKYNVVNGTAQISLPLIVTGLQNLIDIVYGYVDRLESDGWRFGQGYEPNVDAEINRTITWQTDLEKLISYIYTSINEGEGNILNPFKADFWFDSKEGLVSEFETKKFVDFQSSQVTCDVFGNVIPVTNLRVLRDENITQVRSLIPMFSAHIFVNTYEHVVLFENFVDITNKFTLIFDPYLGISISRLLFDGFQHPVHTNRPVLGGHYLKGNDMVQNMTAQIDEIGDYYDAVKILHNSKIANNSLALLGFNKKNYFTSIGISDTSQFNFWQAMIQSKGTNQNIDAYLNNNLFKTAYLDEYWAYKIAEYGDARTEEFPELNVGVADFENSFSIFNFHGLDEPTYPISSNRIIDIDQYSDERWSYTNRYDQEIINYFMRLNTETNEWTIDLDKLAGVTVEKRTELEQVLNKHFYFSAKKLATIHNLELDTLSGNIQVIVEPRDEFEDLDDIKNKIYTILVPKEAVHADQVIIKFYIIENSREILYRSHVVKNDSTPIFTWTDLEWDDFTATEEYLNRSGPTFTLNNLVRRNEIFNTVTAAYENIFGIANSRLVADFRSSINSELDSTITRINGKTLRFIPNSTTNEFSLTLGGETITRIEIEFYGVDIEKNNGTKLLDYTSGNIVEQLPLWHPQVQSVSGVGLRDIDYRLLSNPAKFNHVSNTFRNPSFSNIKYWDSTQVGTTWWDLSTVDYIPYYDNILYPNLQDRISRWGKLADYASVNVYEWVESPVQPSEYDALAAVEETDFSIDESVRITGRVAAPKYISRQRIWHSNPIAWAHLDSPINIGSNSGSSGGGGSGGGGSGGGGSSGDSANNLLPSTGAGLQDTRFILSGQSGTVWLTIDNGNFDDYGIKEGTMLCGWGNSGYVVDEENKPFGQLRFGGEESSVIGQDISDEYFRNYIGQPGDYPIAPLFSTIKSRSGEMKKVYDSLSGVIAETFKNSWLVSSVSVTRLDDNKIINALSDITFEIEGFVWDARFINKILNPSTSYPITNRKGVNDDKLRLVLVDGDNRESIQITNSYLCSGTKPIVFEFNQTNIRITFNINQQFFDPTERGDVYIAHPVYDLFGGKHQIDNFDDLDPIITPAMLETFTDRDGEFNKFDTYTGGVLTGTYDTGSVYIRKMISVDIIDEFDTILLSNHEYYNGVEIRPEKNRGWRIFETPTQEQLDSDAAEPFNLWVPIYGTPKQLSIEEERVIDEFGTVATFYSTPIEIVEAGIKSVQQDTLFDKNNNQISLYTTTWGEWVEIKDQTYKKTVVNLFDRTVSFTLNSNNEPNLDNIQIFLNGHVQPKSFVNLSEDLKGVVFDNGENIPQGTEIVLIYSPRKPSDDDLAFDPTISEDITRQNQFKKDYPFSMVPIRDVNGGITDYKYYFWVENKTTKAPNKLSPISNIVSLVRDKPLTFLTIQNILPAKSFTVGSEPNPGISGIQIDLPIRYQTTTVHGLDLYVNQNDTFKLRFVKNHTLRNEVNGLDKKNTHAEWVLIRPGLSNRLIPKKLWNKFIDSVCGENIKGYKIPSNIRVQYDETYLTSTRYGFGSDQTLCDSDILIKTIKYIIQNTKILKITREGTSTPDYIDFLDLDNLDQYFETPKKCRETLDLIWKRAKKNQTNEIFFACLEDIASLNYEMTDLFKTSRLSVYSLRTVNEIQKTGIVYDD